MAAALGEAVQTSAAARHTRWVRVCHWIIAASVLTLAFTGYTILMVHPRLYWGDAGNDLTPALLELPISRNHAHGGWEQPTPFYAQAATPITANRTYYIFNQNSWARSLHFLAAWFLVVTGVVYLLAGIVRGHFRAHLWPKAAELSPRLVWRDIVDHLRSRIPRAAGAAHYGLLQKVAYSIVVFVATPLVVATGLTMSPAVTAAFPLLLDVFGGHQSARTIHFFAFVAIALFVCVHVAMVVVSGFRRQMRAMTLGD
jgi:thiosulfate reductase cytochrome b subunit